MKLSVIIPVYNEIYTIAEIIRRVKEVPIDKEIIVVDDGSTDGTSNKIDATPGIKIIRLKENSGKGAAVRAGLAIAQGDLIIIQDADLEYDPHDYLKMTPPIERGETSVVYGSRFLRKISTGYLLYYQGNKFLSFLSSLLFAQKITDMETCYKMFHRDVLKKIKLKANNFDIEPEITAKIIKAGYKIKEVPVSYIGRTFSEGKKTRLTDGISAFFHLIKFRYFD